MLIDALFLFLVFLSFFTERIICVLTSLACLAKVGCFACLPRVSARNMLTEDVAIPLALLAALRASLEQEQNTRVRRKHNVVSGNDMSGSTP